MPEQGDPFVVYCHIQRTIGEARWQRHLVKQPHTMLHFMETLDKQYVAKMMEV